MEIDSPTRPDTRPPAGVVERSRGPVSETSLPASSLPGNAGSEVPTAGEALPSSALTQGVDALTEQLSVLLGEALPELGFGRQQQDAGDLLSQLSSKQAIAAAGAVERLSRLVDAAQVMLAGRIRDDVGRPLGELLTAQHFGCGNTIELLQRVTQAPARALSRRLKLATDVTPDTGISGAAVPPVAPAVAAALTRGEISLDAAALITQTLQSAHPHTDPETVAVAEREIVASATGASGQLPEHADWAVSSFVDSLFVDQAAIAS